MAGKTGQSTAKGRIAKRGGGTTRRFAVRTLTELATFFDIPLSTAKNWRARGLPGRGGAWDLREAFVWYRSNVVKADAVSPGLELYRQEKSRICRLQRLALEGRLIDVALLHNDLMHVFGIMRGVGERLGRVFGCDAADMFNDGVSECEHWISNLGNVNAPDELPADDYGPSANGRVGAADRTGKGMKRRPRRKVQSR
jgi:hypothetical protein